MPKTLPASAKIPAVETENPSVRYLEAAEINLVLAVKTVAVKTVAVKTVAVKTVAVKTVAAKSVLTRRSDNLGFPRSPR